MPLPSTRELAIVALALTISVPASAQYGRRAGSMTPGEDYTVEFGAYTWKPTPEAIIATEFESIPGTPVDLVDDLGIEKGNLPDFRLVLRPARKHKLRVSYVQIHYSAEATLRRTIVFRGTTYRVGLPVNSDFEWKAWRFGYEYDFIRRELGYVGLLLDVKYTDVKLGILSPLFDERAEARVPVPAVGGTFRVYPVPFVALTGEVSGFKLPGNLTEGDETADYLDWDLSVILNFTRNIGAQLGYRAIDVGYRADEDYGDLRMRGVYFGAVARF
jgi:hypothetical protein